MQHTLTALFHAQTYTDAWSDYQRALVNPGFPVWDYIILTASNAVSYTHLTLPTKA